MTRQLCISFIAAFCVFGDTRPHPAQAATPIVRPAAWSAIKGALRNSTPLKPANWQPHEIKNPPIPMLFDVYNVPVNDPILQQNYADGTISSRSVRANFEGLGGEGYVPGDPNGDVGPNHYVQMVNSSFAVWDKQGHLLYGPALNRTLWSGYGGPCATDNDGDPIVVYDHLADRWVLSQFAVSSALADSTRDDYYECVAVSQTGDPLAGWYLYGFNLGDVFPDYPKLSVWPDGYYLSINEFESGNPIGAGAVAFERAAMLTGEPNARMIWFRAPLPNRGFLPADLDGPEPPPGAPNYFLRLATDVNGQLSLWEFRTDWAAPEQATFTQAAVLEVAPFDPVICGAVRACVPQPDTDQKLDVIADRLMFRLPYRNFGDHQTLLATHTVNNSGRAGIRWYELRATDGGWSVYQQGTYSPGDSKHRWMPSVAMDGQGNIGLAYSVSGPGVYPSLYFTGRFAADPPGKMTYPEISIATGRGAQTYPHRWGDYSDLTIDPADDATFWYTGQYGRITGAYQWATRIGAFDLQPILQPGFISSPREPVSGHSPLGVVFSDASVGFPTPTSWDWDFDNDGFFDANGRLAFWQYTRPGIYSVRLQVGNGRISESVVRENWISVFDGQSALRFNGAESYAKVEPAPALNFTDAVTVEAWIYPTESAGTNARQIFDKNGVFGLAHNPVFGAVPANCLFVRYFTKGTASAGLANTPANSIVKNQWQHVAVSYSAAQAALKIYINGKEQPLRFFGSPPADSLRENAAAPLIIGNTRDFGYGFAGLIDEIRVWNAVRTPAELSDTMLVCRPLSGLEPHLAGYWPLNEGSKNLIADATVFHHSGETSGTLWAAGKVTYCGLTVEDSDSPAQLNQLFLWQNYPNPFNFTTTLRFQTLRAGWIRLAIYNTAGQEVRTLAADHRHAGQYQVTWDGTNSQGEAVAPGVYLCRLTDGGGSQQRKLILLR